VGRRTGKRPSSRVARDWPAVTCCGSRPRPEKGAASLLAPISVRRQLNELSDDIATKVSVLYYSDAREVLAKALGE